jgi:hypothetical protein
MPNFVETGSTTTLFVHEYDEGFKPLYMHRLETENTLGSCVRDISVSWRCGRLVQVAQAVFLLQSRFCQVVSHYVRFW